MEVKPMGMILNASIQPVVTYLDLTVNIPVRALLGKHMQLEQREPGAKRRSRRHRKGTALRLIEFMQQLRAQREECGASSGAISSSANSSTGTMSSTVIGGLGASSNDGEVAAGSETNYVPPTHIRGKYL